MASPKRPLGKIRISLAVAVAGTSDLLQIPIHALSSFSIFAMPGEAADLALDLATGIMITLIIGFHPVFLPSFIAKTMRSVELMPTWTACVAYAVWARRNSGEELAPAVPASSPSEQEPAHVPKAAAYAAAKATATSQPAESIPAPSPEPARWARALSAAALIPGKGSGLWILAIGAAVIGGILWVRHAPSRHSGAFGGYPSGSYSPPPESASAPESPPVKRPHIPGKSVVAVGPLENHSPAHSTQGFGPQGPMAADAKGGAEHMAANPERVCTTLENILSRIDGVQLVSHEQMRYLQKRVKDKTDGLPEDAKNAVLRSMTPANIIVLMAIIDLHSERMSIAAYGIETLENKCSLRIQVMDVADGSILLSKVLTGSKVQAQSAALVTVSTEDGDYEAITAALAKLEKDSEFKSAVCGVRPGEPVEVEFAVKPDHCDVAIDGRNVGVSPLTLPLAAAKEVKLRLSKAGFKSWEGRIVPLTGLRIVRELESSQPKPQ